MAAVTSSSPCLPRRRIMDRSVYITSTGASLACQAGPQRGDGAVHRRDQRQALGGSGAASLGRPASRPRAIYALAPGRRAPFTAARHGGAFDAGPGRAFAQRDPPRRALLLAAKATTQGDPPRPRFCRARSTASSRLRPMEISQCELSRGRLQGASSMMALQVRLPPKLKAGRARLRRGLRRRVPGQSLLPTSASTPVGSRKGEDLLRLDGDRVHSAGPSPGRGRRLAPGDQAERGAPAP